MKKLFFILILFTSCNNEVKIEEKSDVDSLISKSKSTTDSLLLMLPKSDKKVKEQVERVVNKIQTMETKLENMNKIVKLSKTKVIHDTIYITEKKNFWGKTKTKIDSSQGITEDSTKNK